MTRRVPRLQVIRLLCKPEILVHFPTEGLLSNPCKLSINKAFIAALA